MASNLCAWLCYCNDYAIVAERIIMLLSRISIWLTIVGYIDMSSFRFRSYSIQSIVFANVFSQLYITFQPVAHFPFQAASAWQRNRTSRRQFHSGGTEHGDKRDSRSRSLSRRAR